MSDAKHVAIRIMATQYGCVCVTSRRIFYKEVTMFRHCEGQALEATQSAIPTSEERSEIFLCF
jgi:hypothetical protein